MNLLFDAKSMAEKGTLYQLKTQYNHRNASKDVFGSFNHVEELLRFTTEAHIVTLVLKICNMDFDGSPSDAPDYDDKEARRTYFADIRKRVYDTICLLPSPEEINGVLEADMKGDVWCSCTPGKNPCHTF